ncbi:MAG TPA: multicopper oxidase domain-containing protein, partial [Anaerolineales bacterium]|nr:multicopper oxidase domain-containing protein [Anaerolineales bacterium]
DFLKLGGVGLLGAGAASAVAATGPSSRAETLPSRAHAHGGKHDTDGPLPGTGEVDIARNGFDPAKVLYDFDYGTLSTLPDGRTLREYEITVINKNIEIVPGIDFAAWTYNGRIPGPTLRCTEGDLIRVTLVNGSNHPHSMHFHGFHPGTMDGVPGTGPGGSVAPGERFTYEFEAGPFGLHLYHCHVFPLARHIAKGLYGAFIVDPPGGRPPVDQEMVMVMSGFDVDFDDVNDFYAVNGIPFYYQNHPIAIRTHERVRIYLVNILEFDLLNSFHLHASFFHYYPTGTSLTPSEFTDTIIQGQAQRGILEFSYPYPGMYMFHAHVTEFAELGWNGMFEVTA